MYFALAGVFLSIPVVLVIVMWKATKPYRASQTVKSPDQADWAEPHET